MMLFKDTTNSYAWIVVCLLTLAIIILLAFPFAQNIGESAKGSVATIGDNTAVVLENIKEEEFFGKTQGYPYYTRDNILALGDKAVMIGYNNELYVVGIYSDDKSEVIISANGKSSNGIMRAGAFLENTTIESLIIRSGANVSDQAFKGCINLTDVYLPSGLRYIGHEAFRGTQISSITIPKTVETIGSNAFKDCPNLKTIKFKGKYAPSGFYEIDYPGVTITFGK